ncbi:MAG: GNAT family N-acetyltransferase [Lachnospiraceae bacterium]|nr:GNAT family N-acetyltransferase [Lachnospiraceae bacterium]
MRLLRLTETMKKLVCSLDPFSLLDEPEFSRDEAYGIIADGEEETEHIVGLMLLRDDLDKEPIIDWLYVAPEYRDTGFAAFALDSVFNRAEKNGAVCVHICLRDFYGRALVCESEEGFFLERGFEEEPEHRSKRGERYLKAGVEDYFELLEERDIYHSEYDDDDLGSEWLMNNLLDDEDEELYYESEGVEDEISADDESLKKNRRRLFIRNEKVKKSDVKPRVTTLSELEKTLGQTRILLKDMPVSISELSLGELRDGIVEACFHRSVSLIENIMDVSPEYYNPWLSFAIREGEHISGIFLVHENATKASFEICLIFAFGNKKADMIKAMFLSFINAVKKEDYPSETKVVFVV